MPTLRALESRNINITSLAIPEIQVVTEEPFLPKRDITEQEWIVFEAALDYLRNRGSLQEFLILVASLRLCDSQRVDTNPIVSHEGTRTWAAESYWGDFKVESIADLRIFAYFCVAYPSLVGVCFFNNDQLRSSIEEMMGEYDAGIAYDEYRIACFAYKLIYPHITINTNYFIKMHTYLQLHALQSRRNNSWLDYMHNKVIDKVLFPHLSTPVSPGDWGPMKRKIAQDYEGFSKEGHKATVRLAECYSFLSILAAKEVRSGKQYGVELEFDLPNEKKQEENRHTMPPAMRSF